VGMQMGQDGKLAAMEGGSVLQARLIVWIFLMRILMIVASVGSYWINQLIAKATVAGKDAFDFEKPLTNLVWITSVVSIVLTYVVSYGFLQDLGEGVWAKL